MSTDFRPDIRCSSGARSKEIMAFRVASASGVIFILCSAFQFAQAPVWKGKIVKDNGIVIVQNPREPLYQGAILTLKEDFILGGAKAQGEAVFSTTRGMAVDDGGDIYVGDLRQACVKVYDRTGTYARTIGRRGQGPGEMQGVFSVSISQADQELIVGDANKVIVFDLRGRFKRNLVLPGLAELAFLNRQGNVFAWICDIRQRRKILRLLSPDATKPIADIVVIPDPEEPNMYSPRAYCVLDGQDRLVLAYSKTYEISFYDEHLKIARKIRREYVPAAVTAEDKNIYKKRSNPPGVSGPPKYPCPSVHAAVRSFFIDDHGRLFVQTWERTLDGKQDVHDVFDREGRFVGRIALNVHPDFINPILRILRNDKLYTIEVDEEGYEILKRYSVTWEHPV
jgi:hypothetical protein